MTETDVVMAIQYAETEGLGEQEKKRIDFQTYGICHLWEIDCRIFVHFEKILGR
jgi:hypothetical protein